LSANDDARRLGNEPFLVLEESLSAGYRTNLGVAFFLPEFSDILALPGPECAFSAPIIPSESQGMMAGENVDKRGGHTDGP